MKRYPDIFSIVSCLVCSWGKPWVFQEWAPCAPHFFQLCSKDGQPPTLGWSPTRKKCTTDLEFGTYTLLPKLISGDNCHVWSSTIPWTVTCQPKNGHPLSRGWSPTKRKCTTHLEFGTDTLLEKLTLGDNCHGWSPSFYRMVTYQPKDGHPPEESVLKIGNLEFRISTQT